MIAIVPLVKADYSGLVLVKYRSGSALKRIDIK